MRSQPGEDVSYTVRVDCSGRNLTTFPFLPSGTTVLDLSHNLLDQVWIHHHLVRASLKMLQAAYDDLDVVEMNYINLRSLILSHNRFDCLNYQDACNEYIQVVHH